MTAQKDKILEKLYSLLRGSIKPGLDRISEMLRQTGSPQKKFRSVHVAGTNGKGSVSSTIASVMMESGMRTGLYTSPHVSQFNERIRIDGEMISDEDLVRLARVYLPFADSIAATFFEITTAMAFTYFAEREVDFAIVETGMGGRADATNVLEPVASVITSVSIDHCEYLGNTIEEIAFEKSGIIKPEIPCFVGRNSEEVLNTARSCAATAQTELLYIPEIVSVSCINFCPDFTTTAEFKIGGHTIELRHRLSGEHQIENLCISLAVCEYLSQKGIVNPDVYQLALDRLKPNTGLYGRVECIDAKLPIVVDVSHNAEGIAALVQTLRLHGWAQTKWLVVFGGMADKDIRAMLGSFAEIVDELFLPQLHIGRAMRAAEIAGIAEQMGYRRVSVFEDMPAAARCALGSGKPVLFAGSFHVAEEAIGPLAVAGYSWE